jgi:hypothetical protein
MVELADICRRHGPASRARCGPQRPTSHLAALPAMAPCRPAALGGHVSQGAACEALEDRDQSCPKRHGPTCHNDDAPRWLDPPRQLRLPVPSVLVPVPLPEALRPVARSPPQCLDPRLLPTAAAAVPALALDATARGGPVGLRGVLPTWTRDLASHPPGHARVPGGALSPDGARGLWPRSADWLGPVRALSPSCRGQCTQQRTHAPLLGDMPAHVWRTPWVPPGHPAGTGNQGIASLAPSRRRSALTTTRIAKRADGHVTFRCKARAQPLATPPAARRRRPPPLPPAWPATGRHHRPGLRLPAPHLSTIAPAHPSSAARCRLAPPAAARRGTPAPS